MDLEELVRLVVREVLQSLPTKKNYQALVLFTGGKTGKEAAFQEIKKLEEKGWEFVFACSKAAADLYGAELRHTFPQSEILTNPLEKSPLELQKDLDLVLLPILSQNSLVKIALGISDTLPTLLVKMALLLGKPILAASNAADARYFCQQKGLTKASAGFLQMMDEYLTRLTSFGITLVDVQSLGITAENLVAAAALPSLASRKKAVAAPRVITGEVVRQAAAKEVDLICAPESLVTPLAREWAQKYGVNISPG